MQFVPGRGRENIAYELLEERVAYLELLKSFHDEILKTIRIYSATDHFTLERCLKEIISFIQSKFDLPLVSILFADESSQQLIVKVAAGDEALLSQAKDFRLRRGEGITGAAVTEGKVVVANDVRKDSRYVTGGLEDIRAELAVPIRVRNRVTAVLDLQARLTGRFKKDFITLMEDVGVNISFLIENKHLYDDLKKYSGDLEKKVEDHVSELKKSEERYREIVENSPDMILSTDVNGKITWANRAACSALARPRDELIGLNISTIVKKGHVHKIHGLLRDVASSTKIISDRLEILTKDGEVRAVEMSCGASRAEGVVVGAEISMRDVTENTVIDNLKKNYTKALEEEVVQRTKETKDTQRAAILAISQLAESIDDDTGGHIQRMRHYSRTVAEELRRDPELKDDISEDYVSLIFDLSPLHDLGKVGIRDYILQKTGKLTEEEFALMREHTIIGARALRMAGEMMHRDSIFAIAEMIALYHHEKWDGTGYPAVEIDGKYRPLRGEEIPLCARIVALADVYDALTSKRPYKQPFPHEVARDIIKEQSGKQFDPKIVDAFMRREQDFIDIRQRFPDTHLPTGHPFFTPGGEEEQPPPQAPPPSSP